MWRQRALFLVMAGVLLCCCVREDAVPADGHAEIIEETKYVALTFDDGPKAGTTDRLLDGLRMRGVSATFFLVGEQAQMYPDLVRRMSAEGHQVGNHTWSHVRLEGISEKMLEEEIGKTDAFLQELLGEGGYWLRPPYGLIADGAEKVIPVPMVKWSVDPRDWESRDTEKIVQMILADVKPDSIILLHDIYPASVDAALQVVDRLQEKGWWFVTVEELLRLNGVEPHPGMLYRTGGGA